MVIGHVYYRLLVKETIMSEGTQAQEASNTYKDTLNLPRTDFPIRAQAQQEDPLILQRWQSENVSGKACDNHKGSTPFILHDGPPYANGPIHLGHAYNKILKDIVGKSQRMTGKHVPIKPGWDCHGLPIELKVTKEFPGISPELLKKECRLYAQKWIEVQKEAFKKLGVFMDWEHPYLTMDYAYESAIVKAFGTFVNAGYIEKKKKTVPWCPTDQTVLATAEIEYKDRKDPSIYVLFPLSDHTITELFPALQGKPVNLLVWTTTPWTLPLNRAVMVRPKAEYVVLEHNGAYVIVGKTLADKVCTLVGMKPDVVATVSAELLATYHATHPFLARSVPIIVDHAVSLEDGTAIVHCAPGCGPQDYDVGLKNKLEIFSPISASGAYTAGIEPEELLNMPVSEGQIWVIRKLAETKTLFFKQTITHAYPHCWRCHNGLIFRATNQWFCNLSHGALKEKALAAIEHMSFLPARSVNYLKATIEGRLEWCLSRQRTWGVPIPALLCNSCDYAFINQELIEKVAAGIAHSGIEYWDTVTLDQLGLDTVTCPNCKGTDFIKEKDILDVWFDSGVSHYAVLYNNKEQGFPADMYLEGIDQHRGWFQSSLLTSMVLEQKACTKSFLTHGFTVDERGHKMSKSIGNVIAPEEIIAQLGTDGLRLWVSSLTNEGDAVVSNVLLRNVAEVYRKIRNTCRFLLSNLYDFDYERDAIAFEDLFFIDQYALETLCGIDSQLQQAYARYDFTAVFHGLGDYCATGLSALYLDIIKDRLYVTAASGIQRRSAQTVCWHIVNTLTRLMAPILSFTAEQVSDHYQKNKTRSIHLECFADLRDFGNKIQELYASAHVPGRAHTGPLASDNTVTVLATQERFHELLLTLRSALLKAIEVQREQGLIKHSLEAHVTLCFDVDSDITFAIDLITRRLAHTKQSLEGFLKELLIVSECTVAVSSAGLKPTEMDGVYAKVVHAQGTKCPRCWHWDKPNLDQSSTNTLCNRCKEVLSV